MCHSPIPVLIAVLLVLGVSISEDCIEDITVSHRTYVSSSECAEGGKSALTYAIVHLKVNRKFLLKREFKKNTPLRLICGHYIFESAIPHDEIIPTDPKAYLINAYENGSSISFALLIRRKRLQDGQKVWSMDKDSMSKCHLLFLKLAENSSTTWTCHHHPSGKSIDLPKQIPLPSLQIRRSLMPHKTNLNRDNEIDKHISRILSKIQQKLNDSNLKTNNSTLNATEALNSILLEEGLEASAGIKTMLKRFQTRANALLEGELGRNSMSVIIMAIAAVLKWRLSQGIVEHMADLITNQLDRALPHELFQPLTYETIMTVTQRLATELPESAERYSEKVYPVQVVKRFVPAFVSRVSQTLLRRVDTNFSYEASRQLTEQLGHSLCRSLTHSIVPALLHSLTANPLNDYYCYYCSTYDVYCEYCHYSPQQVYWALYYAGYYSTYYCSYYAHFEAELLRIEHERAYEEIKKDDDDRDQYDRLYDSRSRYFADFWKPKIVKEEFDILFETDYDGLRREYVDVNAIPTNAYHPDDYMI